MGSTSPADSPQDSAPGRATVAERTQLLAMRAGDKVELRSAEEILATLDDKGSLDGVLFMPEMLKFFGRTFTVEAQVNRACDTIGYSGVRLLRDTVLLDDLRCDGSAHVGCQAQCRLYWKAAWLRPASAAAPRGVAAAGDGLERLARLVHDNTRVMTSSPEDLVFRCQATELIRASEPVGWWEIRSFLQELRSRNVSLRRFVSLMTRIVVEEIGRRLGLLSSYPFQPSEMTGGSSPALAPRGLRPGERVRVRTRDEIGKTLDERGKNRGLWFDREMQVYCGHTARVKTKVERFIDERNGKLVELASDAYILEDIVCRSDRSEGRWFCPRAIYPWWRECWLQALEDSSPDTSVDRPTA